VETIILKTIEEEAADCRAAFALAGSKVGDMVNFCHHEVPIEALMEPAENRIKYILENKYEYEQPLRLRMFRPCKGEDFLPWDQQSALRAVSKVYWERQVEQNKAKEAGNWELSDEIQNDLSGLYRASRIIREKMLLEYPFEQLFDVKWSDDIFSTFHYDNPQNYHQPDVETHAS